MLISGFFDESGKFKDQAVISFAGVAGSNDEFKAFGADWEHLLFRTGLKMLTMKEALNVKRPLSKKRPALGLKNRMDALMPFVVCVRRDLKYVISTCVHAEAFNNLRTSTQKMLGTDPHYLAFTRVLAAIIEPLHKGDKVTVICDDEEQTAWPMYSLYRKVRLASADARDRLAAISFADDAVFYPLQAADMIAALIRLNGRHVFLKKENPFDELLKTLSNPEPQDKLWGFPLGLFGRSELESLAREFLKIQNSVGYDINLLDLQQNSKPWDNYIK